MMERFFKPRVVHIGEGVLSGAVSIFLATLSFLGVLAFHFPEYLTTPELRRSYDVSTLRTVMFFALVIAGALGLLNILRNRRKRLGATALVLVLLCIALGGHRVEVSDFPDNTPYLGLDWFILDLLGSTLIFILVEKLLPFRDQPVLRPQWKTDLDHFFLNHLLIGFALLVANQFVNRFFGWAVYEEAQSVITDLPFGVQLFLVILVADLVQYTTHRIYHEVPLFWRLHAVHHSVKHMDWLAGSRQHIIELLITRSFVLTPIFLLGFESAVIDTYVVIVGFQAVFNHANVKINFGWLKYIIVTPQFHHWHHASDEAGIDKNYAAHFSFIDYLFGTAVKGQNEWPEGYGVKGDYVPDGLVKQQLFPFIYK